MTMSTTESARSLAPSATWNAKSLARKAGATLLWLLAAYVLLLTLQALLGRWTPEYLQGRDIWHFAISRMVVPMVMLGIFAAFARIMPSAVMLTAALLFVGTISAIKRTATGEPFQVSDLFLAGQSIHLTAYVQWYHWLMGAAIAPATWFYLRNLRIRWWGMPLALLCVGLLSTYRFEPVSKFIHDNSWRIGIENLTFSQVESERMNGLATHLYFSMAGLRLKTFAADEVSRAVNALYVPNASPPLSTDAPPDIYLILGEAWWRDPNDKASPLDALKQAGFTETMAVSPVYGGTTPNAEFETLTAISVKSFQDGIIPYQHYVQYITQAARTLPRLLDEKGYVSTAYHNFTRRFWLRDQMYPKMGFSRFVSMEDMTLTMQDNDWPTDEGLYQAVLQNIGGQVPRFHFLVTVQTHGPYEKHGNDAEGHEGVDDYRTRLAGAVKSLASFERSLRRSGRPYVLVLFGDHLPGLRLHQWKNGMTSESDPRLHQVPLLIASNSRNPSDLVTIMKGRPLYCLGPALMTWTDQYPEDRFFRHVESRCESSSQPRIIPAEEVIQNQLFSEQPL